MTFTFKTFPLKEKLYKKQILLNDMVVFENEDYEEERFAVLYGSDLDISVENTDKLFNLPIKKLPSKFSFEGDSPKKIDCMADEIYISVDKGVIDRTYTMVYSLDISVGNLEEFQEYITGFALSIGFDSDIEIDARDLTITLSSEADNIVFDTISDCLVEDLSKISEMDAYIHQNYIGQGAEDLFINKFNFPPEHKFLCTQYLIWFGELLKNLKIDADVWTEPHDGGTNLIVSYEKDPELLKRIEETFYKYIQLPYTELKPMVDNNLSPEQHYFVTSLQNQVATYKNQMQLKEAHILYLQSTVVSRSSEINQLKEDKRLLIDSLEGKTDKVEKYSFFNGALEVDKIQYLNKNKSISLDLSKVFGGSK